MMNPTPTSYRLLDAEAQHLKHPETFEIPDAEERMALKVGDTVKLVFVPMPRGTSERMWVNVTQVLHHGTYRGTLANDPVCFPPGVLKYKDAVEFDARHIINVEV